ncbi:MAG: DNA gyrase subunit A, partial [Firmicutes bacterium]|nr:DNA gyrase subunit A [Bacillota bacterium]
PIASYRSQRRGGRGIQGTGTKEEDVVQHLLTVSNHDWLLFFTNQGRLYRVKGYKVPEAGRQAKGIPLVNLIALDNDEQVTAVLGVRDFTDGGFLVMATKGGIVKKTALSDFDSVRRGGLQAITLEEGDELIYVRRTDGNRELLLGTRTGMAIRFSERDVRAMGRLAKGVRGIRLNAGDEVVSMDVVLTDASLLILCANGYGKRTPLSEFRAQSRGGKGLKAIRTSKRNGPVVEMRVVRDDDDLMLITASGVIIRIAAKDIPEQSRLAQGVTLMRLDKGDKVVAISRVIE